MRAVDHKEIRQLQDDLVKNYNVSPVKIRKAGIEEMQSLKNQELLQESRNRNSNARDHSHSQQVLNLPSIGRELSAESRTVGNLEKSAPLKGIGARGQSQVALAGRKIDKSGVMSASPYRQNLV